jgi:ribosomal protein L7Ae-like RNA K-turn-binding protein
MITVNEISEKKISTLLQFALKANKLALGHDSVSRGIYKNKVRMVLYADDMSVNTISSINRLLIKRNIEQKKNQIEMIKYKNKDYFYQLFGKYVGVVGILDVNFRNGLKKELVQV